MVQEEKSGHAALPWRCFHCNDVFHDEREARAHFGPNEEHVVACVLKGSDRTLLRSLREAEIAAAEAWGLLHSESGDFAKAYHSMVARHSQALIRAEEAGYERGLYDARRHPHFPHSLGVLTMEQEGQKGQGAFTPSADIVDRLRMFARYGYRPWPGIETAFNQAADEIERLRPLLDALTTILGPLNVCSDNANVRDDEVLPVDMTMGELRQARAAILKATRGSL